MKRMLLFLEAVLCALLTAGCALKMQKTDERQDLEYTVLEEEEIPEEFKAAIAKEKERPFRLTYADRQSLYIAEGYGSREKTGYRAEVAGLYETKDAIYVHTRLLGPEKGKETEEITVYPYIAVKTEYSGKEIIFE